MARIGSKVTTRYNQVPGWNELVGNSHHLAREAYTAWRESGRAQEGLLYDNMVRTRKNLKSNLKRCKRNKDQRQADSMAFKLLDNDVNSFWKKVKNETKGKTPLPSNIDGIKGDNNISDMWKSKYKDLFNSVPSDLIGVLHDVQFESCDVRVSVQVDEIQNCINKLKSGKACGPDGLSAEHLLHAPLFVSKVISKLLNFALSTAIYLKS